MIREVKVTVTTTGGSGASAGNATSEGGLNGMLLAVYFSASSHANTDLTFSDPATGITLFTKTNYNTAGWFTPLIPAVDLTGTVISGSGVVVPLTGLIKVEMAQANDGTYTFYFRIARERM